MMLHIVLIFSLSAPAFGFDWTGDRPRNLEGTGICSDNTLDAQQTLKYIANGKEWIAVAVIENNFTTILSTFRNPKFRFKSNKGAGGEPEVKLEMAFYDREDSKCETFQSPPLQLSTVEEEVNQPCRQITGQSSDKFAILRVSDYIWLRVFSQDPESYVWVFMCIWWDNTSHDYDSCVSSHMELLIPDLRAKQPDAVDVEAAIRDWSGSITSDDSRYIGHTVSPVSVIWEENNPDLDCDLP